MKKQTDVSVAIYECLKRHSLKSATEWKKRFPAIPHANIEDQIEAASSFWRLQIGSLRINTIEQRQYLQDNLDLQTWMQYFEQYIVPLIVKYDLPLTD